MLAVIGFLAYRVRSAPGLSNQDTVVLADFSNKTGDPAFDGFLRQGLAVALEQSPFLRVLSDQRAQRALRLMKQAPDAQVVPELARAICERTGSNVVLEGSISKLGNDYVLRLRTTNCTGEEIIRSDHVTVRKNEDVLGALTALARTFRSRAGEPPETLKRYDVPLADATTGSLPAWRSYTKGWQLHVSHGATRSLPLFVHAIELDPEFAMAHASLARMYADIEQPDLSEKSAIKAWQLRERASEREKFFISVNYQMLVKGNLEEARKTCEVWISTYPRDPFPHAFLSGAINKVPGRYEDAAEEGRKAVALDPDFGVGYYNEAVNNGYLGRLEKAESALRRAEARGFGAVEFLMLAHDLAFIKNDAAALQRIGAQARAKPGPQSWISNKEAFVHAYSGRLQQARSLSRRAVAEALEGQQRGRAGLWEAGAAVREALVGNRLQAEERATAALGVAADRDVKYGAALALALAGDSDRSKVIADQLQSQFGEDTSVRFSSLPVLRALEAVNKGHPGRALELLDSAVSFELGVPRSSVSGQYGALYPCYVRGKAYLALHDGARAAAEFRKVADHREIVLSDPLGALARLQLARAFAMAGDKNSSKAAYRDFLALWEGADREVPVLQRARTEYDELK